MEAALQERLDGSSQSLGHWMTGLGPMFLFAISIILGTVSLVLTPREEEPQIVVPMADVLVRAPGLDPTQVERQITTPLENLLIQMDGVEHVYSMSRTGEAVVTVRFYVGQDREDALVRLYNQVFLSLDQVPGDVASWVVKPVEIDDVPVLVAALWSTDAERWSDHELRRLAEEVALKLQGVPDANRVRVHGGRPREIRVELDVAALAGRRTTALEVAQALGMSDVRLPAGRIEQLNHEIILEAGEFLPDAEALELLIVNVVDGVPVYLRDVARVHDGPAEPTTYTSLDFGPAQSELAPTMPSQAPMVAVSIAKRRGADAVRVSRAAQRLLGELQRDLFPPEVRVAVLRDDGRTANDKVLNLVGSLGMAIVSVVAFLWLVMGWRAALVVGLAVPATYGLTLAVNLLAGYTINRVTLFALILALGLLVDDPITGVDNIDRYQRSRRFGRWKAALLGLQEVRGALVMSTIAIILAFVPLMFITGMMGPYMGPMAVNVPLAVTFSTVVAFFITPWLAAKLLRGDATTGEASGEEAMKRSLVYRLYGWVLRPLLATRRAGYLFLGVVGVLFVVATVLPAWRVVPLKLLPFDNKDEFQVVLDMPEGTTLEHTAAVAQELTAHLRRQAEVRMVAMFVGAPSPMDFNSLVRHYYMREGSNMADLRVVLAPRSQRALGSHGIALRERPALTAIAQRHGGRVRVVETPPGPPVMAPIVAEIHGDPTLPYERLLEAAETLEARMNREPLMVDIDTSREVPQALWRFVPDLEKAAFSGVPGADIARTLATATMGAVAGHLRVPTEAQPLPVRVRLPLEDRSDPLQLATLTVKGRPGFTQVRQRDGSLTDAAQPVVALGELGTFEHRTAEQPIYRKNLERVAWVYADAAGRPPAETIFDLWTDQRPASGAAGAVDATPEPRPLNSRSYLSPGSGVAWSLPAGTRVVWAGEGELEVTLRVFRDLGLAFAAALVGILLVLTIQTGSLTLALIIMLAIPLTMIGVMPGFAMLNLGFTSPVGGSPMPVFFTATAMIGMIALAGIVVRNSLILVEFVHLALASGVPLDEALVQAGAVRLRPVVLTAGTTLLGNIVITLDPIFNGLAWSIMFGILASTAFTLLVIPVVYALVYAQVPGNGRPEAFDWAAEDATR